MLDFLLTAGIAYGIAYWVSSTGPAYWRPIVGFMLAFVAAFLVVLGLAGMNADGASSLRFMGTGFWYAFGGAGFGVYRARHKMRTGHNAPSLKIPRWIPMSAFAVLVIGIVAAVALPAYQDYAKPKASAEPKPWEQQYQVQYGKDDTPADVQPATQKNAARANPFDQFDPSSARPVDEVNNRPFTYEEAIAPKTQSAVEQEHYRRIYAVHPDADAVHESPTFQAWLAKYPAYQRIMAKGTTQEIIEMFTAYKNQR